MTVEEVLSQPIVQRLGWTLVHFVWQGTAVAVLFAIVTSVLRRRTANSRYVAACAALLLMLISPLVTMRVIHVPSSSTVIVEPAPVAPPSRDTPPPMPSVSPSIRPVEYEPVSLPPDVAVVRPPAPERLRWRRRASDLFEPVLPWVVCGWLVGVLVLSVRLLGGWARVQRLKRRLVEPVADKWHETLAHLSARLKVRQRVRLLQSALAQVPTVVGWLRPVILLPASAFTGLTPQQLEALIAHELAHIRRYDYLVNLLQTVVETLLFYHPAIWWVSHRIRVEREHCCDDLAVTACGDRLTYASALAEMEQLRTASPHLAVASTGGSLIERIRRLVGASASHSNRSSWLLAGAMAIAIVLALGAAVQMPTLSSQAEEGTTKNEGEHHERERAVWVTLMPKSPIRFLEDYHIRTYRLRSLVPGGAKIASAELEIRASEGDRRIAMIPYRPLVRTGGPGSSPPLASGTILKEEVREGWGQLNESERRRIGFLIDGDYLIALIVNGVRCSNVAQLRIDSQFNPQSEPTLKVTPLDAGPGASLPLLGVRVIGPTPEDPELTNFAIKAAPEVIVDGIRREGAGVSFWGGNIAAIRSGEIFTHILDLSHVRPPIEPVPAGERHAVVVRVAKYESEPIMLQPDISLAQTWDDSTAKLRITPSPPALLRGKVIGPDGRPAQGYLVYLWKEPDVQFTEHCNANGVYEFFNIPAGEYLLRCLPDTRGEQGITIKSAQIEVGETRVLDLNMERKYHISGKVTTSDGMPAEGILVKAVWKDPGTDNTFDDSTYTDAEGRYTLGAPFGDLFYVRTSDIFPNPWGSSMSSIEPGQTNVDFVLGEKRDGQLGQTRDQASADLRVKPRPESAQISASSQESKEDPETTDASRGPSVADVDAAKKWVAGMGGTERKYGGRTVAEWIEVWGEIEKTPDLIPLLKEVGEDSEQAETIRAIAVRVLPDMGEEAIPVLQAFTRSDNDRVREAAHGALAALAEKQGVQTKDDYYIDLIERKPFDPNVPGYLGRIHPLTQKVKALYRERLREEPDPQLAWQLATIIQNGLTGTAIEWAVPAEGWQPQRWRIDPAESFATLGEVLEIGFRHSERGSDLWRSFGTALAKLRLLQGDWDGMNAVLEKMGDERIPQQDRPWLTAPPVDWSQGLRSRWGRADESMRSGNCSLEFRFEKGEGGLKGAHVLVKRAPEPRNAVVYTGFGGDTMLYSAGPLSTNFQDSFGYTGKDRTMTRYAVSDESGVVRFDRLPDIPIKIEVVVPTANFPEVGPSWDIWMELEPGKFEVAAVGRQADGANWYEPPGVAELREGETVYYPRMVVRPAFGADIRDWDRVDGETFVLSWPGFESSRSVKDVRYELEMYLSAPDQFPYIETAPVIQSAKQIVEGNQWPVGRKGVGGLYLEPGNIYMFEVRAIDGSGTILARWPPVARVWVPWGYRETDPPRTKVDSSNILPIRAGVWWQGGFRSPGDERGETHRERVARFLSESRNAFGYDYVRVGKAWLDWHDGDRGGARAQLQRLAEELPPGNLARGTAMWLLRQMDGGEDPPRHLKFVPDLERDRAQAKEPVAGAGKVARDASLTAAHNEPVSSGTATAKLITNESKEDGPGILRFFEAEESSQPAKKVPDLSWGEPVNGVRLGAASAAVEQTLGGPVWIRYVLANDSGHSIRFYGGPSTAQLGSTFWAGGKIGVIDPDGEPLLATGAVAFPGGAMDIPPGRTYRGLLDLANYFDLSRPGQYRVVLGLRPHPVDDSGGDKGFAVGSGEFPVMLVGRTAHTSPAAEMGKPVWGQPVNGLQCRLEPLGDEGVEEPGTVVFPTAKDMAFKVYVKNVGNHPLDLLEMPENRAKYRGPLLFRFDFFDLDGKAVERPEFVPLYVSSYVIVERPEVSALPVGDTAVYDARVGDWINWPEFDLEPGTYRARVTYVGGEAVNEELRKRGAVPYWEGEAVSNLVTIAIADDHKEEDPELVWGDPVDGLRAALELVPRQETYSIGRAVDMRLHVGNVGERTVQFTTSSRRQGDPVVVEDEHGNELRVDFSIYYVEPLIGRWIVPPGQVVVLDGWRLGIVDNRRKIDDLGHPTPHVLICKPGRYFIRRRLFIPNVTSSRISYEGDWEGTLETGTRELTVVPAAESEAQPDAAEAMRDAKREVASVARRFLEAIRDGDLEAMLTLVVEYPPEWTVARWQQVAEKVRQEYESQPVRLVHLRETVVDPPLYAAVRIYGPSEEKDEYKFFLLIKCLSGAWRVFFMDDSPADVPLRQHLDSIHERFVVRYGNAGMSEEERERKEREDRVTSALHRALSARPSQQTPEERHRLVFRGFDLTDAPRREYNDEPAELRSGDVVRATEPGPLVRGDLLVVEVFYIPEKNVFYLQYYSGFSSRSPPYYGPFEGDPFERLHIARPETSVPQAQAGAAGPGRAAVPENVVLTGYADETAEGKRSMAASGHAVLFDRPKGAHFVEAVRIFASRYGHADPPEEDFHLYILNEVFQVVADLRYPYAMIERGDMKWYTLRTPSIEVPERFYVAFAFNPHQTKGIYLGFDESVDRSRSFVGLPDSGFEGVDETYDWMVRVYLSEQPSGEKGVQRLADWTPPEYHDPFEGCIELKYDDGESDGMQSYGGGGPAITFKLTDFLPKADSARDVELRGFRIYASRYGSGYDPEQTRVTVSLLDSEKNVVRKDTFPYALFSYKAKWVEVTLAEPVPLEGLRKGDALLMVAFDPEATRYKGIYFHYNENPTASHSSAGTVARGFKEVADREWMTRAYAKTE